MNGSVISNTKTLDIAETAPPLAIARLTVSLLSMDKFLACRHANTMTKIVNTTFNEQK